MFLNPVMLACIGGAVVPLVLHLLSRARYVDVEWGAMMFLHGAQARQRYSARAAQYFLLLLRMGTVSLLALALARPLTRKATAGAVEGQPLTAALLLDCSGSMAYEENGRPRFQMAQAAARQILRGLEPGDRVSLILMGVNQSDSDLEPTADLRAVEARINEAHVVEGRADLRESLNKAADVLERYERSARDMYVVCDRQALSWNQVNASVADDWQKHFYGSADERSASSSARARMFVLPVGNEEADNVCIQAVRLLSGPAINYRQSDGLPAPVDVEVTVRNYGNIPRINLPLSISIDGAPPSRTRTVNLATNQAASVVFPIRFDRAGSHVLTAKVAVARYTGDDHFDLAVDVIDPIRVLVISGDEQSDVMRGSGELISLALAPHVAAGQQGADPFVTVRRASDQWDPADLQRFGVVVLANVETFSPAQARALERYVYGGGSLLIAPGNLSRIEDYDSLLYRQGAGILPAQLQSPTPADGSQATTLLSWDSNHSIFQFLRGQYEAPAATIARYFPAKLRQVDATPLAWYLTGDSFLIEGHSERGRVLLLTTPLDADWTTLPLSNFYLPFVQSSVRYLASGGEWPTNLAPGQPIRLTLTSASPPPSVTLTRPDGRTQPMDMLYLGQQPQVRFLDTEQPGIYRVRVRVNNTQFVDHFFVVAGPREESDLTQMSEQRWQSLQSALHFQRLDLSTRPLRETISSGREARELWLALMSAVFVLLIAEMVVSRIWSAPIKSPERTSNAVKQPRAGAGTESLPIEV